MRGPFDPAQDNIFKAVVEILINIMNKSRSIDEPITLADFPNLNEVHYSYLVLCLSLARQDQTEMILEMYYVAIIKSYKIVIPEIIWQLAILKEALTIFSTMDCDNIKKIAHSVRGIIWLTASNNRQSTIYNERLLQAIDNET